MYIRNSTASTVYKLIVIAFALFGVVRSLDWYGAGSLRYFTIQSNIVVAGVTLYLLVDGLLRARASHGPAGVDQGASRTAAYARGIALLAISLTGIVYHVLLAPALSVPVDFNGHVLHTIVPVGFALDWLVFSCKGLFRFRDVPVWIVYPLVYFAATLLVAAYYDGFYPYPFMDAATYDYGSVALNATLLLVGFGALGVAYVGVDKLLAKCTQVRAKKGAQAAGDSGTPPHLSTP
jgi:hypothetical protein